MRTGAVVVIRALVELHVVVVCDVVHLVVVAIVQASIVVDALHVQCPGLSTASQTVSASWAGMALAWCM